MDLHSGASGSTTRDGFLSGVPLLTTACSSTIRGAADNILAMIEQERTPLLHEIEVQKTRILQLELANLENRLQPLGQGQLEATWKKGDQQQWLDLIQSGFVDVLGAPTELSALDGVVMPEPVPEDESRLRLEKELLETKLKLAQVEMEFSAYRQRFVLPPRQEVPNTHTNVLRQLGESQGRTFAAEIDAMSPTRTGERLQQEAAHLKNALERQGFRWARNHLGGVSLGYANQIYQAMQQVTEEAKRRRLVPITMDLPALERGDIRFSDFATLVSLILAQARANEASIGASLKLGRDNGWSVEEWMRKAGQKRETMPVSVPS